VPKEAALIKENLNRMFKDYQNVVVEGSGYHKSMETGFVEIQGVNNYIKWELIK